MKKMKVMTVVGTRPEIIRLSRVMAKLINTVTIFLFTLDRTMTMSLMKSSLMIWI